MIFNRHSAKFVATVFFIIAFAGLLYLVKLLYSPLITNETGARYLLRSGTSSQVMVDQLESKGIINHPLLITALLHIRFSHRSLKAGDYYFPIGTTSLSLLRQVTSGTGQIYHSFTIVPGWNMYQLRQALKQDTLLIHSMKHMTDAQIMAQLKRPQQSAEGAFYPDTYYFAAESTDEVLLNRAAKNMDTKIKNLWQQRAPNLPYANQQQALVAASIIEKEAHLDTERALIASVIVNRLRKNMLLQCDPTVIYDLGTRFTGKLHRSDLQANTPSNTYVHKGLPPTPIAIPSFASMFAALHPDVSDYLFFVAKGDGVSHIFTDDLKDHKLAIKQAKKTRAKITNDAAKQILEQNIRRHLGIR